jgi:predicted RND superfamily exporter protein
VPDRSLIRRAAALALRHPWKVVLAVALISAASAALVRGLRLEGGIYEMFPRQPGPVADLALQARVFGGREELVVLVTGPRREDVERATRRLAGRLAGWPLIRQVRSRLSREELVRHLDPSLLLLADDRAWPEVRRRLTRGLGAQVARLRRLLLSPLAPDARLLARDPLDLASVVLGGAGGEVDRQSGLFSSPDGRAALIFARPAGPASDLELCRRLDAGLARLAGELDGAGVRIQASGPYLYALHISRALRRDLVLSSVVALAGAALVLLLVFRTLRLLPLAALLSAVAVLWTLAVAAVGPGRLNALSLSFAALCIGLGMDALIHISARFRRGPEGAPGADLAAAIGGLGPALMTASLTTMAAFAAFALSSFAAFAQTGLLAACGLGFTLLLAVLLFPALARLARLRPLPGPGSRLDRGLARLADGLRRRRWPVSAGGVLLAAGAAVVALGLEFSGDLTALAPADLPPVRTDRAIAAAFQRQRSRLVVLVRGQDLQRVLQANDRLAAELARQQRRGLLADYHSLAGLLPSRATQRARLQRWRALDPARVISRIRRELQEQGFKPSAFKFFFKTLSRPRLISLPDLPPTLAPLLDRHLARVGSDHLASTVVHPRPTADLQRLVASLERLGTKGARISVTGASLAGPRIASLLRADLGWLVLLVGGVVLLMIAALLRRPWPVLAVMLSLGTAGVTFVAGLRVLGLSIDLYNLMVIPLVIGYGVDDQIYVVRRAMEAGTRQALVDSGRAVLATTLTSMAAFGALCLCRLPGLKSLGLTAILGLALALLASLVLLPALLALGEKK